MKDYSKEIQQIVKTLEADLPPVNLAYSDKLPSSVKKGIEEHLNWLAGDRIGKLYSLENGSLKRQIEQFIYFEKIFNFDNNELLEMWECLDKANPITTTDFIKRLFFLPEAFFRTSNIFQKDNVERNEFKEVMCALDKIKQVLTESDNIYFLSEKDKLIKHIKKFKDNTIPTFEYHCEHMSRISKEYGNRQVKFDNAEAIFFAREIAHFFRKRYNKAYNKYTALIVNTIFDTVYDETQITKFYKRTKEIEDKKRKKLYGKIDKLKNMTTN